MFLLYVQTQKRKISRVITGKGTVRKVNKTRVISSIAVSKRAFE